MEDDRLREFIYDRRKALDGSRVSNHESRRSREVVLAHDMLTRLEQLLPQKPEPFGLAAVATEHVEPKGYVFDGHWHKHNPNRRPSLPKTKWTQLARETWNKAMHKHNPILDDVEWTMI